MNISFTKLSSLCVLLCLPFLSNGQSEVPVFGESQFAANYTIAPGFKGNVSIKGRYTLYNDGFEVEGRQLEFSHFTSYKFNSKHSVSLGVLYGNRAWFEAKSNEFRLTEQWTLKSVMQTWRIGHRLRAEQRFYDAFTVHRFRYRFAVDTPLNGTKLDLGEMYFVGASEFLLSLASSAAPRWDQRLNGQLGWFLTKPLKLQAGLEYRAERFTQQTKHAIFLISSVVWSL